MSDWGATHYKHVVPCQTEDTYIIDTSIEVVKTVACSVIGSRLDYCNALLTGMSKSNFNKLQRVHNTLARVVLRLRKYEHITPALKELHRLPVQNYIDCRCRTTSTAGAISCHIQNCNSSFLNKKHWSICLPSWSHAGLQTSAHSSKVIKILNF